MGSICTKNSTYSSGMEYQSVEKLNQTTSRPISRLTNTPCQPAHTQLTPHPHAQKKEDVFTPEDYQFVADHVSMASRQLLMGSYSKLISYLVCNNWNEMTKVRAIFLWVTSIDIKNMHIQGIPPYDSALQYILKIKKNLGTYARLFYGLCQMAYIPCVIIDGITKVNKYEIGEKLDRDKMASQWNAIFVNDDWWFVDVMLASHTGRGKMKGGQSILLDYDEHVDGSIEEVEDGNLLLFNEFFFMTDADKFIYTHFPDDIEWQLLNTPLTIEEFEKHFYVRDRFFTLGMDILPESHTRAVLNTDAGEIKICFSLPLKDSNNYRFSYMLYKYKTHTSHNDKLNNLFLNRYVLYEHSSRMIHYSLRFPLTGSFQMDIYALDVRESDWFDIVCSYVIHCPKPCSNIMPFPDDPEIGWGPSCAINKTGLIPQSEATIVSKYGHVDVRFVINQDEKIDVYQNLKHSAIDEAILTKFVAVWQEGKDVVVSLRLPDIGEYALKIFSHKSDKTGMAPNVCNYLIQCEEIIHDKDNFPNIAYGFVGKHYLADVFGVSALGNTGDLVEATDGKLSVKFNAPKKITLICELHTNRLSAEKSMQIISKHNKEEWTFDLCLPMAGEYALNIYAQSNDDAVRLYSMHSYLVTSTGAADFKDNLTQVEKKQKVAIIASETVDTSENEFIIPVLKNIKILKAELYERNSNDPPNANEVKIITEDGTRMMQIKLQYYGSYILNLYDTDTCEKVRNVARYQINLKRAGELYDNNLSTIMDRLQQEGMKPPNQMMPMREVNEEKTNEERICETIRLIEHAIALQHAELLEKTIAKYNTIDPYNSHSVLNHAYDELAFIHAKLALRKACQFRKSNDIAIAIANARAVNKRQQLDMHIALASKLITRLTKVEEVVYAVLQIDEQDITEIREYTQPPKQVHKVMMAAFVLLGSKPSEVQNWIEIIVLMGKDGHEAFMKKFFHFNPQKVTISAVKDVKDIIKNISSKNIKNINAGAGLFYKWVTTMTDEVESFGGLEFSNRRYLKHTVNN